MLKGFCVTEVINIEYIRIKTKKNYFQVAIIPQLQEQVY